MARRDESLKPLSREHHYGLLFALKVRRGLARGERDPQWVARRAADLAAFFERDLLPHFRAEEEALFPALAASPRWEALVDDLTADHKLLGRIAERAPTAPHDEGRLLIADFADRLEKHIRREENELFPLYEELADEALKRAVAEKIISIVGEAFEPRSGNLLFDPW